MKINEMEKPLDTMMLCLIADRLGYICAGLAGTELPPSTVDLICKINNTGTEKDGELIIYDSPENFIESWNKITKGGK